MWAVDDYYSVLGVRVRIRADSVPLGAELRRLLAPFASTVAPVAGRRNFTMVSAGDLVGGENCLLADGRALQRAGTWPPLVARLLSEVNREAVEGTANFAVHAGAVAIDGRVIAFPGESGAGKTTLTAACLLAGFEYVSDEALCVDYDSELVEPYPKPLMLSQDGCEVLGLDASWADADEVALPAGDLGAVPATGVLRLARIIVVERTGEPPELVPLPAADGMAALLRYSFNHYRRPIDAFRLAGNLGAACTTYRLRLGNPHAAAALLRDAVWS